MRKTLLLLFGLLFALSGCAAHDAKINPMLNSMSNANQAINAFGPPRYVSQMPDGASVYVWSTSSSYTGGGIPIYQPNYQTHSGNVYTPSGGYAGSYSGSTTGTWQIVYTPTYQVNLQCELRMIVEASGTIRIWSYQGNACDRLIMNEAIQASPAYSRQEYKDVSGNALGLNDCLAEEARFFAKENSEVDTVANLAAEKCEKKTGGRIPNLSKYYARQALE